jgi:hypothetical protein
MSAHKEYRQPHDEPADQGALPTAQVELVKPQQHSLNLDQGQNFGASPTIQVVRPQDQFGNPAWWTFLDARASQPQRTRTTRRG